MNETTAEKIGAILGILLTMAFLFGFALIFKIDPDKLYGWWGAFWQCIVFVPNCIMSWFGADVVIRAVNRTTAYNIIWWPSIVITVWGWIKMVLNIIVIIRK